MSAITVDPDSTCPTPDSPRRLDPTPGRPDSQAGLPDASGATRPDWVTAVGMAGVAAAAIILSFTALSGLGRLAGWGALAPLLPLTVDAYGLTATRVWLTKRTKSQRVRRFAARNAVGAILASVAGNAVYHAVTAKAVVLGSWTWVMVVMVSAVPPITIGLVSHMIALRSRDREFAAAETASGQETPENVETAPTAPPSKSAPTPTPKSAVAPTVEEAESAPDPDSEDAGDDESGPEETTRVGGDWIAEHLPTARRLNEASLREKGHPVGADPIREACGISAKRARTLRDIVQDRPLRAVGE